MEAPSKL
jgi:hypothetical protein